MTTLVVSIDTEEDNWRAAREGITCANIRELPRLDVVLRRLGVRATYFVNYQVAIDSECVAILRDVAAAGSAEIGAHLHPWNTPPLREAFTPRNTGLKNIEPPLQHAKIRVLTDTLGDAFGASPTVFRAGRWSIGPDAITSLIALGYRVDSSVFPFVDWSDSDDGANFDGAPLHAYQLSGGADVRIPDPHGSLIELPMSAGYTRRPFARWHPIHRRLSASPWRWLRLTALLSRLGVVRKVVMTPELHDANDLLALSRTLVRTGVPFLHLMWHTPTLRPGLSPFVKSDREVRAFYDRIERFVVGLAELGAVRFATVGEAASLHAPATAPSSAAL